MKTCILSESSADEAAIRVLLEGIAEVELPTIAGPPLRTRGWTSVVQSDVVGAFVRHLYYQTDAEAFAVVLDADSTVPHVVAHDKPGMSNERCRLCKLRALVDQAVLQLSKAPTRPGLRTAVGLAVPMIESWYLCGQDSTASEGYWLMRQPQGNRSRVKNGLKQKVYGTDRPSLVLERETAVKRTEALKGKIDRLTEAFPGGFGPLADAVRGWVERPASE